VPVAPVPSLARGYSAPIRLEVEHDDDALALLAAHDSDPVNRWDAAQRSFTQAIRALAAARREGRAPALPPSLVRVVGTLLDDERSDPALVALALAPPDPAYVAALDPVVDVDGVEFARALLLRDLGRVHGDRFERAYQRHRVKRPYAPTREQAASRRLANLCLAYLAQRGDAIGRVLAAAQFAEADNMTDAYGALASLADVDAPERDDLYARFETRWRDEPLVLDKWFALEATSRRAGTLARVRSLLAHPGYNARNPNRVRALVGAFALRNFGGFHAADGSGYAFVADQVLKLDPMNPQLAARLAGAFELWKRFPDPRRERMGVELKRIAAAPGLSPDVGEIVGRTLDD
jgi:aminopeptidase N